MNVYFDPLAGMGPMSFETVTDHSRRCRWPVEGGWCGCRTQGRRPYCMEHLGRAYLPPEAEEPNEDAWVLLKDSNLPRLVENMEAA
ncbi:MAG TPA: hypothetical protein VMT54_04720 [Candidatus Cybelea sp.]|nr:hypothetical protein [Candidatus Cybelea sp.]